MAAKLLTYEVMLGELGETLLKASSGDEALRLLLKTEVALVLTARAYSVRSEQQQAR